MSTPPSAIRAVPAAPARGKVRLRPVAQAVLAAAALGLYLIVLGQMPERHQDLSAYLAAARDAFHGHPLYAPFLHHPFPDATLRPAFIYPPVFALLMVPLGLVSEPVAAATWLVISQAALAAALLLVLRHLRPPGWATTAILCATLTFYPLWIDVVQGQANLLILVLVVAGILVTVRGRPVGAIALGAAAALKLTPLLLLLWLLVERRFREAAWMLGAFALITAGAALFRYDDTVIFFTRVLPALASGTAFYANQSLTGLLGRTLVANPYTDPWLSLPGERVLVIALALLLLGLWIWRTRRAPTLHRAMAFLPLLPLLSTVTWPHHLVILLPVIWLLIVQIAEREWPLRETIVVAATLMVFSLVSRWPIGPEFGQPGFRAAQTTDPVVFLTANGLLLGTLILFLTTPWLLRSR